jgi:hypothetical protein
MFIAMNKNEQTNEGLISIFGLLFSSGLLSYTMSFGGVSNSYLQQMPHIILAGVIFPLFSTIIRIKYPCIVLDNIIIFSFVFSFYLSIINVLILITCVLVHNLF